MKLLELSSPSGLDCAQRTYRWNNPSIESHAKELVLLFQCFYLLIFGSHFLLQKHDSFKRRRHVHISITTAKNQTQHLSALSHYVEMYSENANSFQKERNGSKGPQSCVNDDNDDIKVLRTCILVYLVQSLMKIHHPSASMHSVRASVNVPQSCKTCSFRAHFWAAFSSRSILRD